MGKNYNFKKGRKLFGAFGFFFALIAFFAIGYKISAQVNVAVVSESVKKELNLAEELDTIEKKNTITPKDKTATYLYVAVPDEASAEDNFYGGVTDVEQRKFIRQNIYFQIQICDTSSSCSALNGDTDTSEYPINIGNKEKWISFEEKDTYNKEYQGNVAVILSLINDKWLKDENLISGHKYVINIRMKLIGTDTVKIFSTEFEYTENIGGVEGEVNAISKSLSSAVSCSDSTDYTITFYFFLRDEDTLEKTNIPSSYLPSGFSYENFDSTVAKIITIKLNENTINTGIEYSKDNGIKVEINVTGNGKYKAIINLTDKSVEQSIEINNCYDKTIFDNQSSNVTGLSSDYERIAIYSKSTTNTIKTINKETYKVVSYNTAPSEPNIQVNTDLGISSDLVVFKLYKEEKLITTSFGYTYNKILATIGENGVGNYALRVYLGTVAPINMREYEIKVVNLIDIEFINKEVTYFYGTSYDFREATKDKWEISGLVTDSITEVAYTANEFQPFNEGNSIIENANTYAILATGVKNSTYSEEYFPLLSSVEGNFIINKATEIKFYDGAELVTMKFLEANTGLMYNNTLLQLVKEKEVSANHRAMLIKLNLTYSATAELEYFDSSNKSINFGKGNIDINANDPGIGDLISKIVSKDAGVYTIKLSATSKNYNYAEQVTVRVEKSTYDNYKNNLSLVCTPVTYNGEEQEAKCTLKIFEKEFISGNGSLTLTSINNGGNQILNNSNEVIGVGATNAGTYSITFEFTGDNNLENCAANADNVWTIKKMDIFIKFVSGTGIYTGDPINLTKCNGTSGAGCFLVTKSDDTNNVLNYNLLEQVEIDYVAKQDGEKTVSNLKDVGRYNIGSISVSNTNFNLTSTIDGTYDINFQIFSVQDIIKEDTFIYNGSRQKIFELQLTDVNGDKINSSIELPITIYLNGEEYATYKNNINGFSYGVAINAGTYKLTIDTSTKKDNFNGEESISFSRTIAQANLTIKLATQETYYTGEKFDFTKADFYVIDGLKSNDKLSSVEYASKMQNEISYGNNDIINVGAYNIKVNNFVIMNKNVDRSSNYIFNTTNFDFTIVKSSASITFKEGTIGYTGKEITSASFKKLCDAENETACFSIRGDEFVKDFDIDELSYTLEYQYSYGYETVKKVMEAGTYKITPKYSNNNYDITVTCDLLYIERVKLDLVFRTGTIVKLPGEVVTVPFCQSSTDSACINVSGTSNATIDDSIKSNDIISYRVIGTEDNLENKSASYTIIPYIKDNNYEMNSSTGGELTVEKATIYFDIEKYDNLSYNATELDVANITLKANSKLIDHTKFTYSYTINGENSTKLNFSGFDDAKMIKIKNAGSYTIKVSISPTGVAESDINKYVLDEKEFSVVIAKSTTDNDLYKFTCEALTYNGEEQAPNCKFTNENVGNKIEFLGEKQKNVGSYTSEFKVILNDESYETITTEYVWYINKVNLNVSFIEKTEIYNGTEFDLSNPSFYNIENWYEEKSFTTYVSSIDYNVTFDNLTIGKNGLVDIGEYMIIPNFVLNSGYEFSNNYKVVNIEGKFTISSIPVDNVDVDISLESNLVYNGTEQIIATVKIDNYLSTWDISVSVLLGEKEYGLNDYGLSMREVYSDSGSGYEVCATYAGEYKVKVALSGSGLAAEIKKTSENKVTIAQKNAEVKVIGGTTTYSGINGGFYLDGSNSNKGNCSNNAFACFEVSSIGNDYQEITFKVEKNGDYLTDNENNSILKNISIYNAGTYKVSIVKVIPRETTIEGGYDSNYNITTKEGTIIINKAEVAVILSGNVCTYNGTTCAFVISGERIKYYGDQIEEVEKDFRFSITKNGVSIGSYLTENEALKQLINVGEYTISMSINNENYHLSNQNSVVVTINKAKLEIDFDSPVLTYDGENQSLVNGFSLKFEDGTVAASLTEGIKDKELKIEICEVNNCSGNWIDSSYSLDTLKSRMPLGKDSATYTINFKVKGSDNFEELSESRIVSVKKHKITITFKSKNIDYNNEDAYNLISDLNSYDFDYEFSSEEKPEYVIYRIKRGQTTIVTNNNSNPDFSKFTTGNTYTIEIVGFEKNGFDYNKNYEIVNGSPKGTITIITAEKIEIESINLKNGLVYEDRDLQLIDSIVLKDKISINDVGDIFISYNYCQTEQSCTSDVTRVRGINNVVGKNAGYYYIKKIEITGGNNYKSLTKEYDYEYQVNIAKGNLGINAYYKSSYSQTYTGKEITISSEGFNGGSSVKITTIYKKCSNDDCTEFSSIENYAKDVGTYKVISSFEVPSNYVGYDDIETTLYINKSSINLELNWEDTYKIVEYDGNEHKINVVYSGTDLKLDITYSCSYYNPSGIYDSSVKCENGGTNAGTYYINAEVTAGGNYTSSSLPQATLVIKQKEITFGMYAQTITYDSSKHFIEAKSNSDYDASQINLEYKIDGTGASLLEGVIDAGEYSFELIPTCLTSNYKISTSSIYKATLKIEKASLNEIIISNPKTVYNGEIQTPNIIVDNGLESSNYDLSCLALKKCSLDNLKDAGVYTITATGKGNYKGTVKATFEIEKATLQVSFIGQVQVFGESYSFGNINYYDIEGLASNEEITSVDYEIKNSAVLYVENIGKYTIIPKGVNGIDTNNYLINYNEGIFMICNSGALEVTINHNHGLVYTGDELSLISSVGSSISLDKATFSYSINSQASENDCNYEELLSKIVAVNAGTYEVEITVKIAGFDEKTASATIEIAKADYDLELISESFANQEYTYGSQTSFFIKLNGISVEDDGITGSEDSYKGLKVVYSCENDKCGDKSGGIYALSKPENYKITASFSVVGDYANNYNVPSQIEGNIKINKGLLTIKYNPIIVKYSLSGISLSNYVSLEGDGKDNSNVGGIQYCNSECEIEENWKNLENDNVKYDVGTYSIEFRLVEGDYFTANKTTGTIIVNKGDLTLEWSNVDNTYTVDMNGNVTTFSPKLTIKEGENIISYGVENSPLSVSFDGNTSEKDAGNYKISYSISSNNYNGLEGSKSWQIKKATLSYKFADKREFTYDGKSHMVEANSSNNIEASSVEYTYKNVNGEILETAPSEAGVYSVSALIKKDNYNDLTLSEVSFEIKKYSLSLEGYFVFDNKTYSYQKEIFYTLGISINSSIDITSELTNEMSIPNFIYSYIRDNDANNDLNVSNVGEYAFEVTISETSGNYDITGYEKMFATLTITKAKLDIIVSSPSGCEFDSENNIILCTYNGNVFEVKGSVSDENIELNTLITKDENSVDEIKLAGEYQVTISYEENDCYVSNSKEISVIIELADFDINGIDPTIKDIVYDGNNKKGIVPNSFIDIDIMELGIELKYYHYYLNEVETDQVINVGTYTAVYVLGKEGYSDKTITTSFNIVKANYNSSIWYESSIDYKYGGQTQEFLRVEVTDFDYISQEVKYDIVSYASSFIDGIDTNDYLKTGLTLTELSKGIVAGKYTIHAVAKGNENYNDFVSDDIEITVEKIDLPYTFIGNFTDNEELITDFVYTGEKISFLQSVAFYYDVNKEAEVSKDDYGNWITISNESGIDIGAYSFSVIITSSQNYNEGNHQQTFNIIKQTISKDLIVINGNDDLVYDGNEKELATITVYDTNGANPVANDKYGALTYIIYNDRKIYRSCKSNEEDCSLKVKNAGSYSIVVKIENSSYVENFVSEEVFVEVEKASLNDIISVTAKEGLVFDGTRQKLVEVNSGDYTSYTIDYYICSFEDCSNEYYDMGTDITQRNAGTYYAYYVVNDNSGNYNDLKGKVTNPIVIAKKDLSYSDLKLKEGKMIEKVYDGTDTINQEDIYKFSSDLLGVGDSMSNLGLVVGGTYSNKNVGNEIDLSLSISINSSNYNLVGDASNLTFKGKITKNTNLKIVIKANSLIVGSTDNVLLNCQITGFVENEKSSIICPNDIKVDTSKKGEIDIIENVREKISFSDMEVISNYDYSLPEHIYVSIGSKILTVDDLIFTGTSKTYDKTDTLIGFGIALKENSVDNSQEYRISYNEETAKYNSVEVGDKKIYIYGIKIEMFENDDWIETNDYEFDSSYYQINGEITKREVDVSKFEAKAKDRIFNGGNTASFEFNLNPCNVETMSKDVCIYLNTNSGIIESDLNAFYNALTLSATYDNSNVGENRQITFNIIRFSNKYSNLSSNYDLNGELSSIDDAVIVQNEFVMKNENYSVAGLIKEYDGTNAVSSSFKITPTIIDNTNLQLEVKEATYESSNAGNNINIVAKVGCSSNYKLVDEEGNTVNEITISGGTINEKSATFEIEAKDREVIKGDRSVEFSKCNVVGLVEQDKDDVTASCSGFISNDKAGNYSVLYSVSASYDNGEEISNNYLLTYPEVSVNITKTSISLEVTGNTGLVFNGSDLHLISSLQYRVGNDLYGTQDFDGNIKYCYINGNHESCNRDDLQTKAGVYKLKVRFVNSSYYKDTESSLIEVTISSKSFEGEIIPSNSLLYNGNSQQLASININDDVSENATISYYVNDILVGENSNSEIYISENKIFAKNAGKYKIKVVMKSNNDSFSTSYLEEEISIEKKTLEVIFISDSELTYDGIDKLASLKVCENENEKFCLKVVNGLVADEEVASYNLKIVDSVSLINANDYQIEGIADLMIKEKETIVAASNYEISMTNIGDFITIKKKPIDVVIDDSSKKYNTADPKFTYTVTGLVAGEEILIPLSRDEGEEITDVDNSVGIYSIFCEENKFASSNYEIRNCEPATFTILSYKLNLMVKYGFYIINNKGEEVFNPIINADIYKEAYDVCDEVIISDYIKTDVDDAKFVGHSYSYYHYNYGTVDLRDDKIDGVEAYAPNNNTPEAILELVYSASIFSRTVKMCATNSYNTTGEYCNPTTFTISGKNNGYTEIEIPTWENHLPSTSGQTNNQITVSENGGVYYMMYHFVYSNDNGKGDDQPLTLNFLPKLVKITLRYHHCEADINSECIIKEEYKNIYYGTDSYILTPNVPSQGYSIAEGYTSFTLTNIKEDMIVDVKCNPSSLGVYLELVEFDALTNTQTSIKLEGKDNPMLFINADYGSAILIDIPTIEGYEVNGYYYKELNNLNRNDTSFSIKVISNQKKVTITIIYSKIVLPVIKLNGEEEITIKINGNYIEKGAYVEDSYGNKIQLDSSNVTWENGFDNSKVGTYYRVYTYTDTNGYAAVEVRRIIKVIDDTKPVINLKKLSDSIVIGKEIDWNSYIESITDAYDESEDLVLTIDDSEFDVNKIGTYHITFTVTDPSGNSGNAILEIKVVAAAKTSSSLPLVPIIVGVFGVIGAGVGGVFLFKYLKKKRSSYFVDDDNNNDNDSAF